MTSLEECWLYRNKMHGSIPDDIGQCENLRPLFLEDNAFTGTVRSLLLLVPLLFAACKFDLRIVTLPSCSLFTNVNSSTHSLPPLFFVIVGSRRCYAWPYARIRILPQIPVSIGQLSSLKEMRIFGNHFRGTFPAAVCDLKSHHSLQSIRADCSESLDCRCCTCV